MAKQNYVKCPRCELNYILKKDKYCEVCKQEMKISPANTFELDEEAEMEICPICKANYIQDDEIMCASCAKEKALEDGLYNDNDNDSNWADYLDDDSDSILDNEELGEMVSITDGEDDDNDGIDDDDEDDDFDLDDLDDDFDDDDFDEDDEEDDD